MEKAATSRHYDVVQELILNSSNILFHIFCILFICLDLLIHLMLGQVHVGTLCSVSSTVCVSQGRSGMALEDLVREEVMELIDLFKEKVGTTGTKLW